MAAEKRKEVEVSLSKRIVIKSSSLGQNIVATFKPTTTPLLAPTTIKSAKKKTTPPPTKSKNEKRVCDDEDRAPICQVVSLRKV